MPGADRLAQRDVGEHGARDGARGGLEAVDGLDLLVEGERDELLERRGVEPRRGQADDQEALVELPRADARSRAASAGGPGSASSTSAPTVAATRSHSRSAARSGSARSAAAAGVAASSSPSWAPTATSTGAS